MTYSRNASLKKKATLGSQMQGNSSTTLTKRFGGWKAVANFPLDRVKCAADSAASATMDPFLVYITITFLIQLTDVIRTAAKTAAT